MSGTLWIVGTPIGNLGDLSRRAEETLRAVELIACEDTRHTGKLLHHAGIDRPLISVHDYNERQKSPELIRWLKDGKSIAIVTDAGTPLVSDPGWRLVREAIDAGVNVSWVPGPTALVGALVLSGLPAERFIFEGFLPIKSGARRKQLEALKGEERTVIFYESPHRIVKMLHDVRDVLGDVPAVCARELTKMFEEVRRGTVSELLAHFERHEPRGEFVIAINQRAA